VERGEIDEGFNDAASFMRDRPDWYEMRLIVAHVSTTLPELMPPIDHPIFANTPPLLKFYQNGSPPPDRIRRIAEKALLNMGKDPKFRKAWEVQVGIKPFLRCVLSLGGRGRN